MKVSVPDELLPAHRLGHVHFVGIGGAGLSAIARIMLARGIAVSGSDGVDSPTLDALRALGARVHVGHAADQLGDADTVVVSTAVREDNPEYAAALERGLRVLPRSAALASVMAGRQVVAVAGTHGKTTTTALLTVALRRGRRGPDVRDRRPTSPPPAATPAEGTGDLFVAEADESDGAFLHYAPYAAIVTNIEADHLDHWETEEAYAQRLRRLRRHRRPGRLPGLLRGRRRCGRAGGAAASGRPARGDRVDAAGRGRRRTGGAGRRHALGARRPLPRRRAAGAAAGRTLGYADAELAAGIASFTGTRRRMERKGEAGGVRVYDSYAHHPTEIAGDLASARELAGDGRLLVAFQPHLVSRTRTFGTAMGEALGAADEVVVCDVYLAREDADPSVTGALVASAVPLPPEHVAFVPDLDDVPRRAGRPRAPRRPGADPGRRQRHRGRPAGPRAARR